MYSEIAYYFLGGGREAMIWGRSLILISAVSVILMLILCSILYTTLLVGDENSKKNSLYVLSNSGTLDKESSELKEITKMVEKQKKYAKGATMHPVTFSSPQVQGARQVIERKGVIVKRPQALATVLICHGYMCNKDDTALFRLIFENFHVMTFDFRAHGEKVDENHCCTFGRDEMCDVISAVKVIKTDPDLQKLPLIVYGFSMGAVASILAQAEDPTLFDAMILDCPYDKSENVIKQAINSATITLFGYTFRIPGRAFLERFAFNPYVQSFLKAILKTVMNMNPDGTNTRIYPINPVDSIKKIQVPCFLIHCRNDEKVPVEAGHAIYANMQGFKRFWITNGRRHFDSFFYNPEAYVYRVNKFIDAVISGHFKEKITEKIIEDYEMI